ncbi:MAG: CapA family protein [Armatimonadota bacterium]|nr:CapA family protein [Armatimonadota bacterium]MDR5697155.1 CapA family protein [Armatimonadota bacterium]
MGIGMVTLAFVGDVMLGRGVNEQIGRHPPEWFWGDVLPVLRSAGAVFANLECAITRHRRPWTRTPKVFHFRANPQAVDVLRAANVRFVSLANNHVLDFEEEGLLDTLRHLDEAGIAHAGAGRDEEEAAAAAFVEVAGLRCAVLAATDNEPPFAAGPCRPGTHYLDIERDPQAAGRIGYRVRALREAGAFPIVLSLHWGPNMTTAPPRAFRRFARAAVDGGVEMIYGHSAHVFHGVEVYGGGLILYDTGDFLDDYAVDPHLRNDWSFVFLVDVHPLQGLQRMRMVPVQLEFARVALARGPTFEAICARMAARCAALGTQVRRVAEGLEVYIEGAVAV